MNSLASFLWQRVYPGDTIFTSASLQSPVGTCSSISFFSLKDCFVFVFPIDDYRAENVTKTIAFPRSSCLLTVNTGGFIISLAGGFSSRHISLIRHAMFTNLWRAKTRIPFSKQSFLFKRIYRVCRIDGFP